MAGQEIGIAGALSYIRNNYLVNFIGILKQIEEGTLDQYDASVKVGTILREMYVDSALRRGDNLDKEHAADAPTFVEPTPISWKEYKSKKHD